MLTAVSSFKCVSVLPVALPSSRRFSSSCTLARWHAGTLNACTLLHARPTCDALHATRHTPHALSYITCGLCLGSQLSTFECTELASCVALGCIAETVKRVRWHDWISGSTYGHFDARMTILARSRGYDARIRRNFYGFWPVLVHCVVLYVQVDISNADQSSGAGVARTSAGSYLCWGSLATSPKHVSHMLSKKNLSVWLEQQHPQNITFKNHFDVLASVQHVTPVASALNGTASKPFRSKCNLCHFCTFQQYCRCILAAFGFLFPAHLLAVKPLNICFYGSLLCLFHARFASSYIASYILVRVVLVRCAASHLVARVPQVNRTLVNTFSLFLLLMGMVPAGYLPNCFV